jgi:Carbohydrate binding module (family 6)
MLASVSVRFERDDDQETAVSFATSALRTLALALLVGLSLPLAAQTQAPHKGTPFLVPAQGAVIIEAEDFDDGGQDVAYHDNVLGNAGGQYRAGDVDIIATTPPGGFVVNNFDTGEWLEYTISVQAAGQYEIAVRASSNWTANTPRFHIEIDNRDVTGSVAAQLTGSWNTFQWNAKGGISLPAGVHVLKLVSDAQYFNVDQIRITATPTTPFNGVISLPGMFEAENYDNGGPGISYSDTTPLNDGNQFRTDGVDIIASRDTDDQGTGFAVNGFHAGEWMVYTVSVQDNGLYDIEARVATGNFADAAFHIELDGVNVTGSMIPGATGSFGTYVWFKRQSVQLLAGQHVLKLVSEQEIADVNRIRVSRVTHTPYSGAPVNGTPIALPGTFEAEHFDEGGEGNAYHDTDAINDGGANFRTSEGVDIKPSPDSAGGTYVVNNFKTGESLVYTVNVAETRDYDIDLRAATGATTSARYHIEVDNDVRPSVALPATGSFGTYDWIGRQTVRLTAGQHTLKLVSDQQFFDVNQIRVVAATTRPKPVELLFRSGYEDNTALVTPPDRCGPTNPQPGDTWNTCRQAIIGKDESTGSTWPPTFVAGDYSFELRPGNLPNGSASNPTPQTIGTYMFNEPRIVTGPRNTSTRAMYSEISKSATVGTQRQANAVTQMPFLIRPNAGIDVPELYISYWLKLQPDLLDKMTNSGDWRVVFEWKTTSERRLKLEAIQGFPRKLYWRARLDQLGSNGYVPIWTEPQDPPASPTSPAFDVPVKVGEWFKVEIYWRRSGSDLHAWMAIDGTPIVDKFGPYMGTANEINRIFVHQLYSATSYPIYQWVDDLQIWSTFPRADPLDPNNNARDGDAWFDPPYAAHN